MLRKLSWLLLFMILSACSVFPYRIVRTDQLTAPLSSVPAAVDATCPPACPQPICPEPVCPQPVWPTCPPGVEPGGPSSTPIVVTATEVSSFTPTKVENTATPTKTSTITPLPPTATLTQTSTKVPPTSTPTKTTVPTKTSTPTNTPTQIPMPYGLQQDNMPLYLQNFVHPDKGCNWLGVAGQVFDKSGKAMPNIVVSVQGTLDNRSVDLLGLTGVNNAYGPGGFEVELGGKVISSNNSLFVTLFDLGGKALTYPIPFNTFAECSKNLVLINFKQR